MLSLSVTLFIEVPKNKTYMRWNVFKFTPSNLIEFPYEQASCESGCVSRFTAFLTEPSQWRACKRSQWERNRDKRSTMTCWIVGFALLGVLHALEEVAIWKSGSSCKIGYSFIRFGFAQSTIYASPERCLAQTTWPCPPERRWIVFGRTAWTTRPQRHGFPHWSREGSSSWSPCARFSGAHLRENKQWLKWSQPESFFEFKTWVQDSRGRASIPGWRHYSCKGKIQNMK